MSKNVQNCTSQKFEHLLIDGFPYMVNKKVLKNLICLIY